MDIASIEKLIALVEASGIGELEIAEGASSVRISRVITSPTVVGPSAEPAAVVQPRPAMPIPAVQAPVIAPGPAPEHVTLSPMVGTFYLSGARCAAICGCRSAGQRRRYSVYR